MSEHTKSTHKAEVVPVRLEPHPNADSLSVVQVFGYQCCVRTQDWQGTNKAVYIVPDSLVPVSRPEFAFLANDAKDNGMARVKAKKLRGVTSYGLLVPAPADAQIGDDLAPQLGVTRYEPPDSMQQGPKEKLVIGGEEEAGPPISTGPEKYDIDSFERYAALVFTEGEPVVVTEKLDGSNARFVYHDGRFWVKSRNRWLKRTPDYSHVTVESLIARGLTEERAREITNKLRSAPAQVNGFWQVLERTPSLMAYLQDNPGTTVFGEVYGNVNRIKYGLSYGNDFAAFDVWRGSRFLDPERMLNELFLARVHVAPGLGKQTYSFGIIKELAEGPTRVIDAKPGTIREGVVVKPIKERWHPVIGRVILKCVSPTFLEKS